MAQNKIDTSGTSLVNTARLFFYVKGSKDYPTDQVISDKFGYDNSGDGTFAQTAIFDTSVKDILNRTTNPKQVDNLYSLYSDSGNGILPRNTREGLNIRNDRTKEYISSMIVDNGKVMSDNVTDPTRFIDHIDPNYSAFEGKPYTLANVKDFKTSEVTENNMYPLEHIFWQKIFTICEFIKKYESEIIGMYGDTSKKLPSFIETATDDQLNRWFGREYVNSMKSDLAAENEIGRFIALFIGKCTDASKHFQTRLESGDEVIYNGKLKYNPFRWKEVTGQDDLRHDGDTTNIEYTIDEEQEMFWNREYLNMQYVYGSAHFEPSAKDNRIKEFTFQVKASYTDKITKAWVIHCYLDPDSFVTSSSVQPFAVYTYNDEDMDGVEGGTDDKYGIYDNDYANVTSKSPNLKNNFVSSQSEFQKHVIEAITNIMKDGVYKYFTEFKTLRVTPVIVKDENGNNTSQVRWDAANNSIMQTFYIFYTRDSEAPNASQQIAAVKDYIKTLHTSGKCHPTEYDSDGNILYIGHTDDELDQFLANMYPELFTTTEVYIIPSSLAISNLGTDISFNPQNYFASANIEAMYDQIRSIGGVFNMFEYASNGRATLVTVGSHQKNLPIEVIHVGAINGESASGESSGEFKYPFPFICTAFGTTESRPLTSLSGFANYQQKIFNYNATNMNKLSYAEKLQIILIKLMEQMFTKDENIPYYSSVAGVPISYDVDTNADPNLQVNGAKKNVAKFTINNVNFIVISHKGKTFAKSLHGVVA